MNAPPEALLSEERGPPTWSEQNQAWLTREFASLRARIDARISGDEATENIAAHSCVLKSAAPLDEDFVSTLDRCATLFGLTTFESELLLLAAGVELDSALRRSVMQAHNQATEGHRSSQPNFSLALDTLADPHWDALSPRAPLRRWKLVEMEGRRTPVLQPLHIDERILHFLTDVASFDDRLQGIVRAEPAPQDAVSTPLSRRIARGLAPQDARAPLVLLAQDRIAPETLHAAAREGLAELGAQGLWVLARELPADAAEMADIALHIDRESALTGGVPVIELDAASDTSADPEQRAIALLSHLLSPALLIGAPESANLARLVNRRIKRIDVPAAKIQALEAQARLQAGTDAADAIEQALRPALQQFHLSASALRAVIEQVETETPDGEPQDELAGRVWQACRDATRGGLDALAQRVESQATFDDLVLPATQAQLLHEIAEHLNHRQTVYGDWGLGGRTARGQGLCVLFAGESGTGKTLAAEAIANEVALDLYRIDLATVVSKYIGETEKNLKRVFDAAESSGAVLLFDEADALYGKRSEVKDSHDRYANIEVAYLLQRVEAYRGLAILTTNFRSALDRAFLRRISFIVQFPFPDETLREQIWRRELPATAPMRDVDFKALARMQLSGGHIRTVALNAAFIAAGAGEHISMAHLRHAAQREAAKLERPLTEAAQKVWA